MEAALMSHLQNTADGTDDQGFSPTSAR